MDYDILKDSPSPLWHSDNRRQTKLQVYLGLWSCDSAQGINYRDLRPNDIHVSTTVENEEEVLELRRGPRRLARARRQPMAYMIFAPCKPPSKCEEEAGAHRHKCHPCQLLGGAHVSILAANFKANIWYRWLEHPGTTNKSENNSHLDLSQPMYEWCGAQRTFKGNSWPKCQRHCIVSTAIGAAPSLPSQVGSNTSLYLLML